jgi:hypothetical protein
VKAFLVAVLAVVAAPSPLAVQTTLAGRWQHVDCAAGTPATTICLSFDAKGVVPGLGATEERYVLVWDQSNATCWHSTFSPVSLDVAGKGAILGTLVDRYACDPQAADAPFTVSYTIGGGSGLYAEASGSGTMIDRARETGAMADTWSGTVSVDGVDFDTTPPVIQGATARSVRVARQARRATVRYQVTATDAHDGPVSVTCDSPSGRSFPLGRTIVRCAAADSSGNVATAVFAVVVRRR